MATEISFIRPRPTWTKRGRSRSSHYNDIAAGLFPPPVSIGARAKAHLEHEVNAMMAAQAAGKSEDELRELVKELVASRSLLPRKFSA